MAASFFLAVGLFIATLGLGYLIWQVVVWDQGQTPAQRLLGLRCWRPDTREVAGRKYMALRQGTRAAPEWRTADGPADLAWAARS